MTGFAPVGRESLWSPIIGLEGGSIPNLEKTMKKVDSRNFVWSLRDWNQPQRMTIRFRVEIKDGSGRLTALDEDGSVRRTLAFPRVKGQKPEKREAVFYLNDGRVFTCMRSRMDGFILESSSSAPGCEFMNYHTLVCSLRGGIQFASDGMWSFDFES